MFWFETAAGAVPLKVGGDIGVSRWFVVPFKECYGIGLHQAGGHMGPAPTFCG
ncbi:hypothetical protein [uncultured Gimesia sp.]|uniref:hypothetical protein n=1 Tax=uncultured Gimesia sp. TaxID=1678688 RepID=UPI0030D7B6BB